MGREYMDWQDCGAQAVEVLDGEFVVATASGADVQQYTAVSALLERVRQVFGIEAAFISEWARGAPVERSPSECDADALQKLYGMRLLEADAPAERGFRFEAVPVVSGHGSWRGTLCCRCPLAAGSSEKSTHERALQSVAQLIAKWFDDAALAALALPA